MAQYGTRAARTEIMDWWTLRDGMYEEMHEEMLNELGDEPLLREEADNELGVRIDAEAATRGAADTTLQDNIDAAQAAIDVLTGTGAGSVKKTVADSIADVVAGAPESLDTLKEISDWISGHADDAASMNSAIQENAAATRVLEGRADVLQATSDEHTEAIDGFVKSSGVQVVMYPAEANLPSVINFATGVVVAVGQVAW